MTIDYKISRIITDDAGRIEVLVNFFEGRIMPEKKRDAENREIGIENVYKRTRLTSSKFFNFGPGTTRKEIVTFLNKELGKNKNSIPIKEQLDA